MRLAEVEVAQQTTDDRGDQVPVGLYVLDDRELLLVGNQQITARDFSPGSVDVAGLEVFVRGLGDDETAEDEILSADLVAVGIFDLALVPDDGESILTFDLTGVADLLFGVSALDGIADFAGVSVVAEAEPDGVVLTQKASFLGRCDDATDEFGFVVGDESAGREAQPRLGITARANGADVRARLGFVFFGLFFIGRFGQVEDITRVYPVGVRDVGIEAPQPRPGLLVAHVSTR